MSGIFGVISEGDCVDDLFLGTFYLQHRAQDHCGLALNNNGKLDNYTHKGLLRQQFPKENLKELKGNSGIGCVSGDRQPVSELSRSGGIVLGYDGNLVNYEEIKDALLIDKASFSGFNNPEEIRDTILISKIISREVTFEKAIERLISIVKGDFAVIALTKEGIYAARGWGRKPLILGKKDRSYAVSSESNSFINTGFSIVRDVEPGEIVFLDTFGIHVIKKFNIGPIKYGTFEWIYTAHPASVIDGKNVAEVRIRIGELLAKNFPVGADIISPVPNSGRWHATGYSLASGIPYSEVFIRYDYSDRSYTPQEQNNRDEEAKTKLIPVKKIIEGKRIILVDDSIVRGTQTLNQTKRLKELGAKEVHARIACPPLMAACKYGKTTSKDEDCIARRMSLNEIQEKLGLDSLNYATVEILEQAIGLPREKLCLECWGC
jgi:amidophosphoribosyltransferase